jgi:hypothetical protein
VKPLHHHVQRLAQRLLDAELADSHEKAKKAIGKAEKHQRKINRWHKMLEPLQKAFRLKP